MRHHPSRWLIAPALALLTTCTSCHTTPPSTPTPPSTTPAQPTTPAGSPTPATDSPYQGEKHQIYQALQLFLQAEEEFSIDPRGKFKPLQDLVTPDYYNIILGERDELSERGWKGRGDIIHLNIQIADPTTQNGQRTTEATYCMDLTQFITIDANTNEPADNPLKPTAQLARTMMTQMPDGTWKAANRLVKKVDSCPEH